MIKKNIVLQLTIAISLLVSGVVILGCSSVDSKDKKFGVKNNNLIYFQDSYSACRDEFRKASSDLKAKYPNATIGKFNVPSKVDNDLTIDYVYIPPSDKKVKLLILSSGVHGVEGFSGSAAQQLFMKEYMEKIDHKNTGVLLLHGMNPYGFKYQRRVTENNVDLNRNSDVSADLYQNKNKGYTKLNDFLNPTTKVDVGSFKNRFFYMRALFRIMKDSVATLRQAILQGQYEYEKGLYFGGKTFEPQIVTMQKFLGETMKDYATILELDIHTGYGERGKLHLFPNPMKDKDEKAGVETIFKGYDIDWGDEEDFYTVTGDFTDFIGKIYPEKFYMPMTFEYGTMDSQTTGGSIKSIHNMILENQGIHYGYDSDDDKKEVLRRMMEMYYPSSPAWRSHTLEQTRKIFDTTVERYNSMN